MVSGKLQKTDKRIVTERLNVRFSNSGLCSIRPESFFKYVSRLEFEIIPWRDVHMSFPISVFCILIFRISRWPKARQSLWFCDIIVFRHFRPPLVWIPDAHQYPREYYGMRYFCFISPTSVFGFAITRCVQIDAQINIIVEKLPNVVGYAVIRKLTGVVNRTGG